VTMAAAATGRLVATAKHYWKASGKPRTGSVTGMQRCYLDAASAETLHPAARETLLAALDSGWADPVRLHHEGRTARLLLDNAREVVADALAARPDEIHFTSSGTAAIRAGLAAAVAGRRRTGSRVVHGAVEHSAVLEGAGPDAVPIGVDAAGRVDVGAFGDAVDGAAVACLQSANHEVGTRQPVAEVVEACARAGGVPLLVDAAASVGREDVPPGWSLLTASAHKWGGPAGVGVLAVRKGVRVGDEALSTGYPNVPAVLASAAALQARRAEASEINARHREWIDGLRKRIAAEVPDVEVVGDAVDRLPHILTFSCLYVDGEAIVTALDAEGIAVSSGSACTSSTLRPSHVLAAMGVLTHGNVRVSLGRDTTYADVNRVADAVPRIVSRIRSEVGL
jgi:cysteine desulfurase